MKRIFQTTLALCCLVALAAAAAWRYENGKYLVDARDVLFSRYATTAEFDAPPAVLLHDGFARDDSTAWLRWRAELREAHLVPALDSIRALPSELARAEAVARAYAEWGGGHVMCGSVGRLIDKVRTPGCCSDHTEVFLALAPAVGIFAREVGFGSHEVVEIYDRAMGRWVLVDPMYGIGVTDEAGRRLSLTELREARLDGRHVNLVSFRGVPLRPTDQSWLETSYFSPDYRVLQQTFGNNVVAEDHLRQRFARFPKPLVAFAGLVDGELPWRRLMLDQASARDLAVRRIARDVAWASFAAGVVVLVIYPLSRLASSRRRAVASRRRERALASGPVKRARRAHASATDG